MNDWVRYLNEHPDSYTPNIDRLANKGIVFTNAYVNVPICNPSRLSIMTGLHPMQSGITSNRQQPLSNIFPNAYSLNQHLQDHDYNINAYGKIYHNADNRKEFKNNWKWNGQYPKPENLPIHGMTELTDIAQTFDWGAIDEPETNWGDHQMAKDFEEFIGRYRSESPFFTAIGFRLPHLPRYFPQSYLESFKKIVGDSVSLPVSKPNDLEDLPEYAKNLGALWTELDEIIESNDQMHQAILDYLVSVYFIDTQVGIVLDAIARSNHRDNTVIIFASDHGYMLGEKSKWRKNVLWRDAVRVPLIVYDPRGNSERIDVSKPVSLIDIYPTIEELAQIPKRDELLGRNLLELVDNANSEDAVVIMTEENDVSIITKQYQLIEYNSNNGAEFYNNEIDPHQWNNLIDDQDHQFIIEELISKTDDFKNSIIPIQEPKGISSIAADRTENGLILSWDTYENDHYSRFKLNFYDDNEEYRFDTIAFDNTIELNNSQLLEIKSFDICEINPPGKTQSLAYTIIELNSDGVYEVELSNKIFQNYPNPFNSTTTINYQLNFNSNIELILYDILGNEIQTIDSGFKERGIYSINFEAENIATGIYFYSLKTERNIEFMRMTIIK